MAIQDAAQRVATGDNVMGHVVSAAVLGDGFASTVVWAIQTWGHQTPPASVSQLASAVGIVGASYLLKKLGQ